MRTACRNGKKERAPGKPPDALFGSLMRSHRNGSLLRGGRASGEATSSVPRQEVPEPEPPEPCCQPVPEQPRAEAEAEAEEPLPFSHKRRGRSSPRATARRTVPSTYALLVTPFPSRIYPLPDTTFWVSYAAKYSTRNTRCNLFFSPIAP